MVGGTEASVFPPVQLNCCGITGTIIDSARDTCPKKEGLEALITTVSKMAAHEGKYQQHLCLMGTYISIPNELP